MPQLNRRLCHALLVAVIAVAALTASFGARASAEEETPQLVTELQPGLNPIGWIEAEAPVDRLFDEIPRLDAVYAWNAVGQRYVAASRSVPTSLWTLQTLEPGAGLYLNLGEGPAVKWRRSAMPAQGRVRLHAGANLVAWLGRDHDDAARPISHALRGIGDSLESASVWDAASRTFRPLPFTDPLADPVPLRRGEAIWVQSARGLDWFQPTGMMPRISVEGSNEPALRQEIDKALMRTLDHFWFEFGIEADFSEYSVAATRDDEVLTLEIVPLPDNDWSRITGGAISRSLNYCGRGELARRVYTSLMLATLQAAEAAVLPQWLRDGMTIWLTNHRTWHQFYYVTGCRARHAPSDSLALGIYAGFPHSPTTTNGIHGIRAAEWLTDRAGRGGWIDYIRIAGRDAVASEFAYRFQASHQQFLDAFEPRANADPALGGPATTYEIELIGPIHPDFDEVRFNTIWLRPTRARLPHEEGRSVQFITFSSLRFHLQITLRSSSYALQCSFFPRQGGGITTTSNNAAIYGGEDVRVANIRIEIHGDVCSKRIRIERIPERAYPEAGAELTARQIVSGIWRAESFSRSPYHRYRYIIVPQPGRYAIAVPYIGLETEWWFECAHWHAADGGLISGEGNRIPRGIGYALIADGDTWIEPRPLLWPNSGRPCVARGNPA